MDAFHRTKRESRLLLTLGLSVAFLLSGLFLLIGFSGIEKEGFNSFQIIFGLFGIALFVLFFRGAWISLTSPLIHIFSIDPDEIEWGFVGKEKQMKISELSDIYWEDFDGFTLILTSNTGKKIRMPYIMNVVSHKSRGALFAHLQTHHAEILTVRGIDPRTEEDALRRRGYSSDSAPLSQ
jgi:hypothetical protein